MYIYILPPPPSPPPQLSNLTRLWGGSILEGIDHSHSHLLPAAPSHSFDQKYDRWAQMTFSDSDDSDAPNLDEPIPPDIRKAFSEASGLQPRGREKIGKRSYQSSSWTPLKPPEIGDRMLHKKLQEERMKDPNYVAAMAHMDKISSLVGRNSNKPGNKKLPYKVWHEINRLHKRRIWEESLRQYEKEIYNPQTRSMDAIVGRMVTIQKFAEWEAALALKDVYDETVGVQVDERQRYLYDNKVYNILIHACNRAHPQAWRKALELAEEMEDQMLRRGALVYDAQIRAHAYSKQWEKALAIMDLIVENTVRLDLSNYPCFITILRVINDQKKAWRAKNLLEWMDRVSVQVNSQEYHMVERETYKIMDEFGVKPVRLDLHKAYGNDSWKYLPNGRARPWVVSYKDGSRFFLPVRSRFEYFHYDPYSEVFVPSTERLVRRQMLRDDEALRFTAELDEKRQQEEEAEVRSATRPSKQWDWRWW
mmetsp:Transcript_29051/g.46670  ORF Transcript_29051/g.46670 Transcript_29051/m.46670 type:complete len:478 (-) Transcript_29051:82-1515(-)